MSAPPSVSVFGDDPQDANEEVRDVKIDIECAVHRVVDGLFKLL